MRMVFALWTFVALSPQDDKLAVPEAATQKKNEKTIHDLLKSEYAKKDQNSKRTLAKTLMETGTKEDDKALVFSFFKEASEVAAEGMDFETAMDAIERLEKLYKVEPESPLTGGTFSPTHELRKALLKKTVKLPQSANDAMAYVKAAAKLADLYYAEDSFDDGLAVSQFADTAAKNSGDSGLQSLARSYVRKHGDLKKEHDKIVKAHLKILADPSDPESCGTWGQFLVFVKGDWERGLGFLAKGKDGSLKTLAEKESAKASPVELAEGWLGLADKAKEPDKTRFRTRARFWLEKAQASVSGVDKLKIDQKLKALDDAMGIVDLLPLIDPAKILLGGANKTSAGKFDGTSFQFDALNRGDRVEIGYIPPPEYDLKIIIRRNSGNQSFHLGLSNGQKQWIASLGGFNAGIRNVDGKPVEVPESEKVTHIGDAQPAKTIVFSVRKTGFTAACEGTDVLDWSGDYSRVSVPAGWEVKGKNTLFLCGVESRLIVEKLVLTPVSGQGQKLK
jgi:hypothetical protein